MKKKGGGTVPPFFSHHESSDQLYTTSQLLSPVSHLTQYGIPVFYLKIQISEIYWFKRSALVVHHCQAWMQTGFHCFREKMNNVSVLS